MEFKDIINNRRSIRKYKPGALPEHVIDELIAAAAVAPSGLNLQPWRFVAVQNEAARRLVAQATPSRFVADAPLILVCCTDMQVLPTAKDRMKELEAAGAVDKATASLYGSDEFARNLPEWWAMQQLTMYTAIAVTHLILKATDLGLGSCWVGHFDEAKVKAAVGLDARHSVTALLPVGYAGQEPAARPRLPAGDLLLNVL
jgi:nitroreductase